MSRYVVILELPNGYMDCVAIEEDEDKAYGIAYNMLCNGVEDADNYYITTPCFREGENGMVMYCKDITTRKVFQYCTVLHFDD